MWRLPAIISALVLSSIYSACSEDKKPSGIDFGPETGCIQGVLVNGLSGERISIPAPSSTSGIHVIVRNNLLSASGMSSSNDASDPLRGEFTICGIPLENDFPLVAWVDGYEKFSAEVGAINSAIDNGATQANGITYHVRRPVPTDLVNIALYPAGSNAADFTLTVIAGGEPLANALVYAKQDGTNQIANRGVTIGGNYIAPKVERPLPLSGTTDEKGEVTFTGDKLVLGATYDYAIIPPDGAANYRSAAGSFAVGLVADTNNDFSDRLVVSLDRNVPTNALAVVGTSLDTRDFSPDGKLVVYFNRPIEFVPETKDNIIATLAGNPIIAKLEVNNTGNDGPETCTATIDGYKLTLTPIFQTDPDIEDDIGLTITYAGISIRSTSGGKAEEITINPNPVPFYR